jgi:hypothetical protein
MMNALEFATTSGGLCIPLYPLQKFLLKLIFGVPLDYQPEKITIWSRFREEKLYEFTESEYLKYSYEEGRCNIDSQDAFPTGVHEAAIFLGRRSGKDTLLVTMALYRLYLLLHEADPQRAFNLIPGSFIDFTLISQDDDDRMFHIVKEEVNRCSFFTPFFRSSNDNGQLLFETEKERNRRDSYPNIRVTCLGSNAKCLRGPSSLFLGFNELAHFKSSDDVYNAATPSTCTFREGNKPASQIVSMSAAWYNTGKMYDLHKFAMEKPKESEVFTLREKTVNANPHILGAFLKKSYDRNHEHYKAEWEAEFLDKNTAKKR